EVFRSIIFCQAEDGIRDRNVTGVQTCALPIFQFHEFFLQKAAFNVERIHEIEQETRHDVVAFTRSVSESLGEERKWVHYGLTSRSEERRVGKGVKARWWPYKQ